MAASQRYFFLDTIGDVARWACVSLSTSIIGPTVKATPRSPRFRDVTVERGIAFRGNQNLLIASTRGETVEIRGPSRHVQSRPVDRLNTVYTVEEADD